MAHHHRGQDRRHERNSVNTRSATGPIETPATTPVVVHDEDVEPRRRGGRLNVVAAWVGIVAGTVFVVAVIFFSGFVLGASVVGGHHHHGHGHGQMEREGGGPRHGWQGGPGGPGGPGGFGPGFQGGPGGGGPGQGPGSLPPTPPGR
ncbi:hypothetical protein H7J06_15160 [Mycobacterium hodleri]|uniref:hypothetical protein n=1 Tax=Mycolicibacterium hodleri TaxID=49897 RepID=UPI0023AA82DD|nr:hypothetical protein [Mycolicibacterium hodleri]MCV7134329.1 hypothetical protein [Mycolicibacterium hodleri]